MVIPNIIKNKRMNQFIINELFIFPKTIEILVFIGNSNKRVCASLISYELKSPMATSVKNIKYLKNLGLLKKEIGMDKRERTLSLTEKGKYIADRLIEIDLKLKE